MSAIFEIPLESEFLTPEVMAGITGSYVDNGKVLARGLRRNLTYIK